MSDPRREAHLSPLKQDSAPQAKQAALESGGARAKLRNDLRGMNYEAGRAALQPEHAPPTTGAPAGASAAIADQLPADVDLKALRLSFSLPKGKKLQGNWQSETRTKYDSRVTLEVTPTGLRVYCSPAIYIDAIWPVQNMSLRGAEHDFTTGKTSVDVYRISGLGEGFVNATGTATESITKLIADGIAGTAAAQKGYNPLKDPNIMGTLNAVASNFSSLPSAGGGADKLSPAEMTEASAGATLALAKGFKHETDGGGVVIAPGGQFDVTVEGGGSLDDVAKGASRGPAAGARAAKINGILLRSDDIVLTQKGEPIVKLKSVNVGKGGQVTLQDFELMGKAKTGAGIESLFLLLGHAAAAAGRGAPGGLAMRYGASRANPRIVPGLTQDKVEEALTAAVQNLLRENATAVPGINLAEVLGVQ